MSGREHLSRGADESFRNPDKRDQRRGKLQVQHPTLLNDHAHNRHLSRFEKNDSTMRYQRRTADKMAELSRLSSLRQTFTAVLTSPPPPPFVRYSQTGICSELPNARFRLESRNTLYFRLITGQPLLVSNTNTSAHAPTNAIILRQLGSAQRIECGRA